MNGPLERFLDRQLRLGLELAHQSDLVDLEPIGRPPVQRYRVRLATRGLVRDADGAIREHEGATFGVWFPSDYLRRVSPFEILSFEEPVRIFHPNATLGPDGRVVLCLGRIAPATGLVDLIEHVSSIWSWVNRVPRESDALNHEACRWARLHADRLPVDARPLARRAAEAELADFDLVLEDAER